MSIKSVLWKCACLTAGIAVSISGTTSESLAGRASEASMRQAGYNAGLRLKKEGYSLRTLKGAPYYTAFLKDGQTRDIRVNIPSRGKYVLLVGGDNDTADLDAYFPQINARDTTLGNTAFFDFRVSRPGNFFYRINMLDCQTPNCGVYAVLLRVGN